MSVTAGDVEGRLSALEAHLVKAINSSTEEAKKARQAGEARQAEVAKELGYAPPTTPSGTIRRNAPVDLKHPRPIHRIILIKKQGA
jgi:hypothetical protein